MKSFKLLLITDDKTMKSNYKNSLKESEIKVYQIGSDDQFDKAIRDLEPEILGYDISNCSQNFIQDLETMRTNFPDVVRMIISNTPKEKKVVNALFEGFAKVVLPITPNEKSVSLIKNILRIRDEIESDEVKHFIMSLDSLPSLPTLYDDIMSAIRDDKDLKYIAKIIEKEPSLASDVIKTVNSPAYSIETSSLQTALAFLGINAIKDVIVSFSAFKEDLVPKKSLPYFKILQDHSTLTNNYTHEMYQFLFNKKLNKNIASLPLIGNIGLILLLKSDHNKFLEYLKRLKDFDDYNYEDLDDEIFNISHSKLGGYLFNWWGLPIFTVDATLNHHKEFIMNPETAEFIEAFRVADILAWQKLGYLEKVQIEEKYTDIFLSPEELRSKREKIAEEERAKAKKEEEIKPSEKKREIIEENHKKKKSLFGKFFSK